MVRMLTQLSIIWIAGVIGIAPAAAQMFETLRTPDARFAQLPGYDFAPHYHEVPWGKATVRMHFIDEGPRDGKVVLLLHGQPTWSFMYRKLISGLSAQGFRVIAPDLIGYGRSDKPARLDDYSYARHIESVDALTEHLALRDATLVVHDWGGLIGLPLAARHPQRFARLALFNTSLNDGNDIESPRFKAGFDRWIELLRTVPLVEVDKVVAAQVANPPSAAVLAAYMAPYPDGRYQAGLRRMSALIPRSPGDAMAGENAAVRATLRHWDKPVMIAFSADSERIHPGQYRMFTELFPKSSIWDARRIAGTRHFLFEDRPEAALRLLLAFTRGEAAPLEEEASAATLVSHPALTGTALYSDVVTYAGFGDQRTGSQPSLRSLEWVEERLHRLGYRTRREPLSVEHSSVTAARLALGSEIVSDGVPLWPVSFTDRDGLAARIVAADRATPGDIALLRLPFSPYASAFAPAYRALFQDLLARQPAAIVAITEHPSGEVVALNIRDASDRGRAQRRQMPVLLVGQKHASRLEAALGTKVTLTLSGATETRNDANLIAETGPENGPLIILSTPRNGWFAAGGERGPGLAIMLGLARWLREEHSDVRVRLIVSSHHELGGLGMESVLHRLDPKEDIALWVHLGANIATREAETGRDGLVWSDAANARRGVAASPAIVDVARQAFARVPGITVASLDPGSAVGEAALIARAGRFPTVAIVGYQLAHHTRLDDARATSPEILAPTASALAQLLSLIIAKQKARP